MTIEDLTIAFQFLIGKIQQNDIQKSAYAYICFNSL